MSKEKRYKRGQATGSGLTRVTGEGQGEPEYLLLGPQHSLHPDSACANECKVSLKNNRKFDLVKPGDKLGSQ